MKMPEKPKPTTNPLQCVSEGWALSHPAPGEAAAAPRAVRRGARPAVPEWEPSFLKTGLQTIFALLALLFSGCAVSFVSGYDPVTDEGIQEVAKKTETIISDVLMNKTGEAAHRENYRQAQGALAAVGLRAELYGEKNKAEREIIGKLKLALADLEELHRLVGSFRPAEAEGVRSLLRSLMHHELSKKHSMALAAQEGGR